MRLLFVEDELEMAAALGLVLAQNNYLVDHVATIALAREAHQFGVHDAIILDRQLPDGDGLDFLRELRAAGSKTPVIILTANNRPPERISGLDDGADDYIGKPFLADELMARLRVATRRAHTYAQHYISEGNVKFNLNHQEVTVADAALLLTRRETLVLETLLRAAGRTVLRTTLEDAVYGYGDDIQSNSLESHVSRVRKKLADANADVTIHTIRGLGYLLKVSA